MKKTLVALTLAASLGLAACSNPADEVVVSTSYGEITQGQFYDEIKSIAGTQLLEQVIVDQILASKYEVTEKDEEEYLTNLKEELGDSYESQLAMAGLTEETLKDRIPLMIGQEKAMEEYGASEEELKAYYDKISTELEASHILLETAEAAAAVLEEIKAGGDFATLAKEKSIERNAATSGGSLGWFQNGQMVAEFHDAAYELEVGEISEPVQSEYGYHIIKLTGKRPIENFASFEDKKEEIKQTINDWNSIVTELVKESKVDIKDADLKSAFGLDAETEEKAEDEEDKK